MSTLAAALAWAARGFRVFPLAEGTKDQPVPVGSFVDAASRDPRVIEMWWRDPVMGTERDYNIGVSTTGLVVIDIDVRNGKRGLENYLQLGGGFDTLIVKTPSGGRHAYFNGPDSAGRVGFLGKDSGLDVRSYHNYVVAPGSATAEGCYSVEIDAPLTTVPENFKPHLRPPLARPVGDVRDFEETPAMIERAVTFLQNTPAATWGSGGDEDTYKTAARLRDFAITEATAFKLLLEHWNPRCLPHPWPADMLKEKVANAYAYGTAPFGQLSAETHYASLKVPDGEMHAAPIDTERAVAEYRFGNALDPFTLPQRPWLYTRLLMRGSVTTLVGAGSAGKSMLTLTIAAHLALGKQFNGYVLRGGPMKSIIYNGEDDLDEQTRRLWAICSHFRFDWPSVRDRISLVCRREVRLVITEGDPPRLNNEQVVPLVRAASNPEVGFVSIDPLVTVHQSPEENNTSMRYVMETGSIIAEQANVALSFIHHVAKPGASSKIGEMYAARGGGEIVNAARVAVNLSSPTAAEAPVFGIEPSERNFYVAMSDAKLNYALAYLEPKWLKKKSVRLPNGDEVGVLEPYDMAAKVVSQTVVYASMIAAAMKGRGVATVTHTEAADILKTADLFLAKMPIGELRAKVLSVLATPVETSDGVVKVIREMHGNSWVTKVVLE